MCELPVRSWAGIVPAAMLSRAQRAVASAGPHALASVASRGNRGSAQRSTKTKMHTHIVFKRRTRVEARAAYNMVERGWAGLAPFQKGYMLNRKKRLPRRPLNISQARKQPELLLPSSAACRNARIARNSRPDAFFCRSEGPPAAAIHTPPHGNLMPVVHPSLHSAWQAHRWNFLRKFWTTSRTSSTRETASGSWGVTAWERPHF